MTSAPDPQVAAAFTLAVLIAVVAGTVATFAAGRTVWRTLPALLIDAVSLVAALFLVGVVTLGPWTRDLGGVFVVLIVAVRLAPGAFAVIRGAPAWISFVVALGAYGALAAWLPVASLPLGDQIHYLLVADRLGHGSLDVTIDSGLFLRMLGIPPSPTDAGTHVVPTVFGPRPVQGYALPLWILPGWILLGRLGAGLLMAVAAAWASYQTLLILRDLVPDRRIAGWTWLIASFSAPLVLLATHEYPNAVGAAVVATAFRAGFTAPKRRPALAAALLALTLFLTPRDGLAFVILGAFLLRDPLSRRGVALAGGAVTLAAIAVSAVLYGIPLPYPGYIVGTGQAQDITQAGSIVPSFWIGLPAILFDRTFGLAGSAPWVFIGLIGLIPALRMASRALVPAAAAVGLSLVALSFFRYWEGGYAPPARYFVDVLPLWAPFVAFGIAGPRSLVERAVVAVLIAVSALTALVLSAVPSLALNSAFDDRIRDAMAHVLGLDPLGWLPSFQPVTPDWYLAAYLRLIPAVAGCAVLVWFGWRERALRSSRIPQLVSFLALNAIGIAVVAIAASQPWIAGAPDAVEPSLLRKWLPFALAIAAAATAAIASQLDAPRRGRLLARHFLLYLVPLALTLVAYFGGPGVVNGQLGAIYLLIAIAFAANAVAALWEATAFSSDRAMALQLGLAALVAALILLPYHRTVMPTASDEPHYLIITESLLYDRDLDLRNDYEGDRYLSFYPTRLPDMHGIEVGRAVYPIRDIGLPVLAVGPYAIAGRLGVLVLLCFAGAALAAQLYLLLRDLRFAPPVAFLATATTALVHPIFTYTTQIYPELLTALVFVTVARLVRRGPRATVAELAVASALTGTLPWLSTRAWPIVAGVGLVIAWCALRPLWDRVPVRPIASRVVAGALPFVSLVLALSYLNWMMFGVFLPGAGYFVIRDQQQVLVYAPWIGGTGLLFDRVFGLVPRAPIYLLAFLGAVALWRRARAGHGVEIAALALGALLSFAYIADIAYWWADGSPPSRYLLASLPLLVAGVAGGWELILALPRRHSLALAGAALLVLASGAVTYVYAVLPNIRYDLALDVRATGSSGALFAFLARATHVDPGLAFPSLVTLDSLSVVLAVGWTALVIVLVWVGYAASKTSPLSSP